MDKHLSSLVPRLTGGGVERLFMGRGWGVRGVGLNRGMPNMFFVLAHSTSAEKAFCQDAIQSSDASMKSGCTALDPRRHPALLDRPIDQLCSDRARYVRLVACRFCNRAMNAGEFAANSLLLLQFPDRSLQL